MGLERIHPRLLEDCHHLGSLTICELLLNRNAAVPWFILVPDTALEDMLDLPQDQASAVLVECAAVSAFIKRELAFSKVNFAGLGNVVPQMHLHIIGRSTSDACWPQPVWGVLSEGETYDSATLKEWQRGLVDLTGMKPSSL